MVLEHASIAALGELFACEIRLRAVKYSRPKHNQAFRPRARSISHGCISGQARLKCIGDLQCINRVLLTANIGDAVCHVVGDSDFTGKACAIHWTWDTYGAAKLGGGVSPTHKLAISLLAAKLWLLMEA
jgi:hypothetical protein